MRKLFLAMLLMVMACSTSFAFDEFTGNSNTQLRNVGGRQSDPVVVLKLVRNASRDAAATGFISTTGFQSGDALIYDLNSDDGVTVSYTIVSGDAAFAGIAAGLIPSADTASSAVSDDNGRRNWGWIVINGRCLAKTTAGGAGAPTAGQPFYTSTDTGAITSYTGATTGTYVDAVVVAKKRAGGFFFNADAGSSQSVVYVDNM